MFCKWFATIFTVIFVMMPAISHSDLILKDSPDSLKNELYWLKSTTPLTFETVQTMPLSQFNAPLGRIYSDGYSSYHYWFRFSLDFHQSSVDKWLLEIPFSLLDYVVLYEPTVTGDYSAVEVGDRFVFSQRSFPVKNFLFPLKKFENQQTYYLHITTQDSVQVPLDVWPDQEYVSHYAGSIGIQMAIFGAMLVMILYNVFIFLSTRDKTYLFYIAFISLMLLFQLGLNGFSHQWLWPNYPWWSNISIPLFGLLSLNFGLLFVRKLLHTRKSLPTFDIVLRAVSYCMLITVPVILFGDYDFAIDLSLVVTSIFFNLTLVAIILLALKGDRTAKIVLVAWSVFLVSGSISMLGVQGWLPLEIAGTHVLQIGSMMEIVLLSLALADRIKTLRKEKLAVEKMSTEILKISNEQLEQSIRMKDAFLATISHEIKTPMNAILGSSQLLRIEPLNKQQMEYVSTIDHSGKLLLSILDNVLGYSKLEAGKVVLKERDVDTVNMFDEILNLFEIQLKDKPIRIWCSFDNTVPRKIHMDDSLFKHVIMNLLANAIKFTAEGYIWLHVSMEVKDTLKVEVSDTGIGMSIAEQGRIFYAFTQADDSTSRNYGGTGLGLVISKSICGLMSGDIEVVSQLGMGTTFTACVSVLSVSQGQSCPALEMDITLDNKSEAERVISKFGIKSGSNCKLKSINTGQLVITNGKKDVPLSKVITMYSMLEAMSLLSSQPQEITENVSDTVNISDKNIHVLAVDDDPANRMIIEKMLNHLNVSSCIVESGEQAINVFSTEKFDLILMDIEMPIMDGYEATKMIRMLEVEAGLDSIHIIALSAHVAPEFKDKAIASGMNDFLSKPVQVSKLKQCFDQLKLVSE